MNVCLLNYHYSQNGFYDYPATNHAMKKLIFIGFIFLALPAVHAQQAEQDTLFETYCITSEELHLYRLINEYRLVFDLEIIPLSKSLSYVAHMHVRDLHENRPDLQSCNLHSWSDKGNWTPCCYAKDPNRTNCMWSKPRELTTYMGNGQELILWENIQATPRSTFDQWRNFEATNDVFLHRGRWQEKSWKAIGIAIYEGYASVWLGEVVDQIAFIPVCDDENELASNWLITETSAEPEDEQEVEPEIPIIKYYLIVSSFKDKEQAITEVERLKNNGYLDAKMHEKDGNFRISIHDYEDIQEAVKMRRQLNNVFKGIWIMEM